MISTAPAFKAALLARLKADVTLANIQISWGHPYPDRDNDELVIIGNASGIDRQYVNGLVAANEFYDVELVVSIIGSGRTPLSTLSARAYALANLVETNVIAWKNTSYDAIVNQAIPGAWSDNEQLDADGNNREASVVTKVRVAARV